MRNEKGFTLIELLVVVAIIGILAAIAIPQFAEYKTRAFNSRAQSDLRNGLTSQEAYFVDEEAYLECADAACVGGTGLPGFVLSDGVSIDFITTATEFSGASCHERGDRDYSWASAGTDANVMQDADNSASCTPTAPALS